MANNAVLLRQRVKPCNVAAMAGNALDLAAVLRWPTTHWTSQRCCDVRQRATTPAKFQRFCFFFYTRQLEERKRMGEREKF
jgi:hypothetical protein